MAHHIAILLFDQFQLLDAAGPISAFDIAGRMGSDSYRLTLVSVGGGAVQSTSGVALETQKLEDLAYCDTLLVVGGAGIEVAMQCEISRAWLASEARRGVRVCSVCSGSLLLAASGLLDGRRATTHWRRTAHFAQLFPKVKMAADKIYVRDGDIWTSGGISAGIDLALALVSNDHGSDLAAKVAREMVVYFQRPGDQSQFSAIADLSASGSRFERLLAWARANVGQRLTVEVLANEAAMSPRNFVRVFRQEVGMSPAKAIERLRLEAARANVEGSAIPIEHIAVEVGFRDPERMRRAFIRAFGFPPQAMRRQIRLAV